MSETVPAVQQQNAATATPAAQAAAQKPNALQVIEAELAKFFKQREQAIANLHAVEGAIQGAQHLLSVLRTEAAKAVSTLKADLRVVEHDATVVYDRVAGDVETTGTKIVTEVEKVVKAVEAKV